MGFVDRLACWSLTRYDLQTYQVAYATLYTGGFSGFVAFTSAPIATGWSDPVPGWDSPPTEDQRLFTAHRYRTLSG